MWLQSRAFLKSALADSFLDFQNRTALVLTALGAGPMRKLLFLAVRADGKRSRRQKIVRAAKCSAALGMTPFRIRHGTVPFNSDSGVNRTRTQISCRGFPKFCRPGFPVWSERPVLSLSGCVTQESCCPNSSADCPTPPALPSVDPQDPIRRNRRLRCGSGRNADKDLCNRSGRAYAPGETTTPAPAARLQAQDHHCHNTRFLSPVY